MVLTLFISFFLIKDGPRIWNFVINGSRGEAAGGEIAQGETAWRALVNYIRGTTVVAAIHALFIGLALWLLGVPLLVPFIVLIFIAAYVPIIGILVVGALAILVTLATKGWVAAVILLGVFILENQIEDHLLQPLVIGRIIRLHPLAIILALAVGGIVAGHPGRHHRRSDHCRRSPTPGLPCGTGRRTASLRRYRQPAGVTAEDVR